MTVDRCPGPSPGAADQVAADMVAVRGSAPHRRGPSPLLRSSTRHAGRSEQVT